MRNRTSMRTGGQYKPLGLPLLVDKCRASSQAVTPTYLIPALSGECFTVWNHPHKTSLCGGMVDQTTRAPFLRRSSTNRWERKIKDVKILTSDFREKDDVCPRSATPPPRSLLTRHLRLVGTICFVHFRTRNGRTSPCHAL